MMNEKKIAKKLKSLGLLKASDLVCSLACNCIRLQTMPTKESKIKIGESKLGGYPDMPDDVKWPTRNGKYLSLLAQINLKDLNNFEKCEDLPESGWLYFFYEFGFDNYGFDSKNKRRWKVIYVESSLSKLSRRNRPGIKEKADIIYNPCRVKYYKTISLPTKGMLRCNVEGLSKKDIERYDGFINSMLKFDLCEEKHQIFGFPLEVQGGDMRCECELYSRGLDYNKIKELSKSEIREFEQSASKWSLLFQIDSDDKAGMMWIDSGRLYFWIKVEDFFKQDFDNVWMILQCY